MRYAHTVEKVRAAEGAQMALLPEGTLMRRASTGLATVCARLLGRVYATRVLLLVGGGDNGADTLYAGGELARRGARVTAVLAGSGAHEAALAFFRAAGGRVADGAGVPESEIDLVIDGLVGIGGRGALREPYAALVRALPPHAAVIACDVPSGVDADTGEVGGEAVSADVTVTFGTLKPGLLVDPGASFAGLVELVDIGLDLPEADVVAATTADLRPPRPTVESDKYRRGVVGVLAGGDSYTGAAVLAVGSALHAGAGMVRFASTEGVVDLVRQRWPEAVTTVLDATGLDRADLDRVGRVQAWVAGPGLGTDARARDLVLAALATDVPVLVDADGLTVLAELGPGALDRAAPTVLTPHAGELARLLGAERSDIEARRLHHVRLAAETFAATVLLKGSTTLVATRGEPVRANLTGTPWLAAAGTGDVLSGLAGTLLSAGMPPAEAAATAAHLHGLAARIAAHPDPRSGPNPITAWDVLTAIPAAFRQAP
ncbi:NAD(P)H-hydrate dehydratase [Actinocorallia longicatena]|uniref:Bifunctional NAD(P)H-hydrate repair enzyme n=1 Tax=Actinocorallia longicatena TaxID=111803 RepID=A0ABP6Q3Q4_9ACTN